MLHSHKSHNTFPSGYRNEVSSPVGTLTLLQPLWPAGMINSSTVSRYMLNCIGKGTIAFDPT